MIRIADGSVVVLVGPSGAGKTTWANTWFRPEQVVSSDALRGLVGEGEWDQRAGTDAFAVLDDVLERRLKRRLLTVVDTLGLDPARRAAWRDAARRHGAPCVAVVFDTPAAECRARNKRKVRPVPANVLNTQLEGLQRATEELASEGFDAVHRAGPPVRVVAAEVVDAAGAAERQRRQPVALRFGLQLPSFAFDGGPAALRANLTAIARRAEDVGFTSLWVMDHFLQIPQVGREWEDMLESYSTLSFLAGVTDRIRLGPLVTGVTYRNVGLLGKSIATLDVLSGGRAIAGLGAAWFEREHKAYGWDFPPARERLDLLEDALEALPLMWGPGAKPYKGRRIELADATCYPRPLQERVPILVGGSGEKRTLRLVARHADACNLFGSPDAVRQKLAVLERHCADAGRDPSTVRVTHLSSVAIDGTDAGLEEQMGRCRELADAGVHTAIVNRPGLATADDLDDFAPLIAAFPAPAGILW